MIHMNMQEMARVWRVDVSNTSRVMRRFRTAAAKAASAPIAELSTREVQPFTKGTIMAAKIPNGSSPALSSRSFSAIGTLRSSSGRGGPSSGCMRQRIAM